MKTADVVIKVKLADKAKGEDVLTFRYATSKDPRELFSKLTWVVFAEQKAGAKAGKPSVSERFD